MPDWRELDSAREQLKAEAGEDDISASVVCAHSQEVRPRFEMVRYGDRIIAPEHKQAFVQSLQEGKVLSDQVIEGEMRYVGFWWRVRATVINNIIKRVISMLLVIPLGLLAFTARAVMLDGERRG